MKRPLSAIAIVVLCGLSACGDTTSTPNNSGNSPEITIDGRKAPDANGNNRDQPDSSTSP